MAEKLDELFALVFTLEESLIFFLYSAKAEDLSCVQVLVGEILE